MARMATRAVAKAMLAGVAACACASGVAQGAGSAGALPAAIAQAGAAPEFRARQPVRLAPTPGGPTSEAPLSFGHGRPAGREGASAAAPAAEAAGGAPVSPAARAGREDEARALARLRVRLEETLARHSGVDARVQADRGALRVVSHGPSEPPRKVVASRDASRGPARRKVVDPPAGRPGAAAQGRDWSYSGDTGPAHWASLDPAWAACAAEVPQSPIDIRDGIAVGLPPIGFDLPPAILTIRDDGRAIRAVVREGPAIVTLGRRFELREISFHQPAEFRIEGRAFDLSANLLHRDEQGRVAVIVVLFEIGDESTPRNPVVQAVLDYLPLAPGMLMPVAGRKELAQLLPADPGYYNFVGSLSSPPCTEGVIWMVMREPVRIPPSQVAIFARVHPMNVRPLQPLAGRLIKQSE